MENGYNKWVRLWEMGSIASNILLSFVLLSDLIPFITERPLFFLSVLALAWPMSDFTSGFFHWLADTFGKVTWPLIGNAIIRSFREHHVDPDSITRHDWVETNGGNFFAGVCLLFFLTIPRKLGLYDIAPLFLCLGFCINFWSIFTNQFHKWAHMQNPPPIGRFLQRAGIAIKPENHGTHHQGKFDCSYCITSGVLNPWLNRLGFWPWMEKMVRMVFTDEEKFSSQKTERP